MTGTITVYSQFGVETYEHGRLEVSDNGVLTVRTVLDNGTHVWAPGQWWRAVFVERAR